MEHEPTRRVLESAGSHGDFVPTVAFERAYLLIRAELEVLGGHGASTGVTHQAGRARACFAGHLAYLVFTDGGRRNSLLGHASLTRGQTTVGVDAAGQTARAVQTTKRREALVDAILGGGTADLTLHDEGRTARLLLATPDRRGEGD